MLIDQFLTYEKDNNLFQLEIDGFRYWHYIRIVIYDAILNKDNQIGQAHSNLRSEHYYKRVLLKLKQIPYWLFFNPLWSLKEKDLLILNHPRRVKNGEFFDCLYTDELLQNIDKSYYVFEQPILERHFQPIKTEEIRYLDYINLKFTVYYKIKKQLLRFSFSEDTQNIIKHLLSEIGDFFEVTIDENKILSLVEMNYLYNKFYRKAYLKVLDKINPKFIIEVVSYSADRLLINELAKEKGIPVMELQHGTMGKYHIAYNFSDRMGLPNFPDYIFTFGQFWKDNTRLPINGDKIKVIGWPYFEQKVNNYNQSNKKRIDNRKTILFISQGTIGKELSKMAVYISNNLDNEIYKIIYKLHPGEYDRWKKDYPWLIDSRVKVIDDNQKDMHYHFAQADVQVGVYSTAIFEGLAYKLETIIIKLYGYETMAELYETGLAQLIQNVEELINICLEGTNNKTNNLSYLWEPNSMNNMINEINNIIENER